MRSRIALALVLLLSVAAPATAHHKDKPIDERRGIEIGRAAPTNSLNGIYVSPHDGEVYIASVGGDEITVHHPRTGRLVDRIGPERGVHGPDDVFVTEDGTVYWTEILTGNVGMLKPDGTFTHQFVGPGVNPITMSDDGRLFVNQLFLGQGLWELDPNLVDPPVEVHPDLQLNSFDFGPDGHLYAPAFFTGDVLKIDVDSTPPLSFETVANVGGVTSAVKFNSVGEAFAVDIGEGKVLKLDLSGANAHDVLLDVEGTIDNIAINNHDVIFAAVGVDNQIIRIHPNGNTRKIQRGGLGLPGGVAVADDGRVWVTELFALKGFDKGKKKPAAAFYDRFVAPGTGFAGATTVEIDGDNLLLTSGFANAVMVMDPETGAVSLDVRAFGAITNAVRHNGIIAAADAGFGNVVNAEDTTEVILEGLIVPLGMASDGTTLYVADWVTGAVWATNDSATWVLAEGLLGPEGMALDGDRLLVVETGRQQVTAIDVYTGVATPAIVGLDYSQRNPDGFLPYGMMSGVDVDDKWIYVSDDGVNKVYKFRKRK